MAKLNKNEITIAVIGLIGILVTALFSNWGKLFPPENQVTTEYTGYRATGDFENELRYYFEVSGTRKTIENMQTQMLQHQRVQLLTESPEDKEKIEKIFTVVQKEGLPLIDELIRAIIPVYKNHFTVQQIQELNKFYSTKIMQEMLDKMPMVTLEFIPIQMKILGDWQKKVSERINEIIIEDE